MFINVSARKPHNVTAPLGTGHFKIISLTRRERERAKSDNEHDNEDEGDS